MSKVCQINYSKDSAQLFALLAGNMLNEDLAAGPPQFDSATGDITQLYGMCPMSSGSICTFSPVGPHWYVRYNEGEDSAVLALSEIPGWFTGDY
jgi:hypothetical protein